MEDTDSDILGLGFLITSSIRHVDIDGHVSVFAASDYIRLACFRNVLNKEAT